MSRSGCSALHGVNPNKKKLLKNLSTLKDNMINFVLLFVNEIGVKIALDVVSVSIVV